VDVSFHHWAIFYFKAIQIEIQIIMLVVAFILMVVTPKLAAQDPQIQQV
jgi:competence protein ComGC